MGQKSRTAGTTKHRERTCTKEATLEWCNNVSHRGGSRTRKRKMKKVVEQMVNNLSEDEKEKLDEYRHLMKNGTAAVRSFILAYHKGNY